MPHLPIGKLLLLMNRLSGELGRWGMLFRGIVMELKKNVPQWLKPPFLGCLFGTAEAVPFLKGCGGREVKRGQTQRTPMWDTWGSSTLERYSGIVVGAWGN
jgi:hypothetical protein